MSQADRFIAFAIKSGALWVSTTEKRKLRSGRMSPYFFDTGKFTTGESLYELGIAYAVALAQSKLRFDVIFGPAYKGIPLVSITAASLFAVDGVDVGYAFNRKEAKDHGEECDLIGAELMGKHVVIIDDVTTRGDALREGVDFIVRHGGTPVGIVIAFDRQESGEDPSMSATQQLELELGIPVLSIASAYDLVLHLLLAGRSLEAVAIMEYLTQYAATVSVASLKN